MGVCGDPKKCVVSGGRRASGARELGMRRVRTRSATQRIVAPQLRASAADCVVQTVCCTLLSKAKSARTNLRLGMEQSLDASAKEHVISRKLLPQASWRAPFELLFERHSSREPQSWA